MFLNSSEQVVLSHVDSLCIVSLLFSFKPWTLDIGHWILDIGHWTLDIGHWTLDIGHRTLDIEHWTLDIGHWTLDIGHWTLVKNVPYLRASYSTATSPRRIKGVTRCNDIMKGVDRSGLAICAVKYSK